MEKLTTEQSALLDAIKSDDLERVKYIILKEGVCPNFGSSDYIENNPICFASMNGAVSICFWLLKEGGAKPSHDIFRFVTNVVGDISTSNLIHRMINRNS